MNLDKNYLLWQPMPPKRAYSVLRFDDAFLKKKTGSLTGEWPEKAFCVLDHVKGARDPFLPDSLFNSGKRLIVSPRLKGFLERAVKTDIEFWPIKIIDRTGRPLGEPYFYVHLLNNPDCLDLDASGAIRSRILPTVAEKLERLAFKSDPQRLLFRPSAFQQLTLIHWPLAEAMANVGFSGFRLMGLFDHGIKADLPPHPGRRAVDVLCEKLWTKK